MRKTKKELSLIVGLVLSFVFVQSCQAQVTTTPQNSQTNTSRDGIVTAIKSMTAKRASHTATLLGNGKVLIAGGFVGDGEGLPSTELFDPTSGAFASAGNMKAGRASHTATLLTNGKVLIAGGFNGDYLDSAELFDPATNRFTAVGRMVTARSDHKATLLNDGRVLLAGGTGKGWTFLSDAEIFDPKTNTFKSTGAMTTARESHTATLLNDGRVLITGGHKGRRANITIYTSSEIYDPAKGTFTTTGSLTIKRHKHDATRLADGRVLIIGGSDERDGDGAYRNAEVFNPENGTFIAVKNNMNSSRYKLQGTAILLKTGKVLIAGGANRAEVFDPATESFSFADGDMGTTRLFATATLLKNGHVLITGGYSPQGVRVSENAWIYRT